MSLSVNGSNQNNPFALQSLWQQQAWSASGTQAQSDPLSQLLAELGQQGTGAASTASGAASTTAGTAAVTASTSPQFSPQTLQALLALQDNGSNPQSLFTQLTDAANDADLTSGQAGQTQPGQDQHGRHHHHWDANGSGTGGKDPLAMLSGAASQTTTNANGSTTTSITYANGSSVNMTTAAAGTSGTASSTSSTAGGAGVTGNNLIEQLIQMQAQLLTPSATQSIATA
jgi:hypothetical protein